MPEYWCRIGELKGEETRLTPTLMPVHPSEAIRHLRDAKPWSPVKAHPQHAGPSAPLTGKAFRRSNLVLPTKTGRGNEEETPALGEHPINSLLHPHACYPPCPDTQPQGPGQARLDLVLVLVAEVTQLMRALVPLASDPWGAGQAGWKEHSGF